MPSIHVLSESVKDASILWAIAQKDNRSLLLVYASRMKAHNVVGSLRGTFVLGRASMAGDQLTAHPYTPIRSEGRDFSPAPKANT